MGTIIYMRKIPKLERKNYHRIILKNNPRFNRKMFQFEFENGEVLRLKLYEHLKVG